MVPTVSRSLSSAPTNTCRLIHGQDCFTVSINPLHIYWSRQPMVIRRLTSLFLYEMRWKALEITILSNDSLRSDIVPPTLVLFSGNQGEDYTLKVVASVNNPIRDHPQCSLAQSWKHPLGFQVRNKWVCKTITLYWNRSKNAREVHEEVGYVWLCYFHMPYIFITCRQASKV